MHMSVKIFSHLPQLESLRLSLAFTASARAHLATTGMSQATECKQQLQNVTKGRQLPWLPPHL